MKQLIYSLGILLLLASCKTSQQKETQTVPETSKEELSEAIQSAVYTFPSSTELLGYLDNGRYEFHPKFPNNHSNAKLYLTSCQRALNIGVYLTDMGYLNLFNEGKGSTKYLESILLLSEKLHIEYNRNDPVIANLERNKDNIDSLRKGLMEANAHITEFLSEKNRENHFAMISVGAYIEFLYISTNLIGDYSNDMDAINRIAETRYSFENMYNFVQKYASKNCLSVCETELKQLADVFASIDVEKHDTEVKKDESGKLSFGGGDELKISEETYVKLTQIVDQFRQKITETEQN
ncbi:MAG: hypothetical protein MI922_11465 [Bacteroidales bacterium]|nr:hypothetical protein [Bacteroidales bacterium]